MGNDLAGIHHMTAIAGDPQRNLDFYTGVIGLRLVKMTVNFDDPGTYHLYYGDGQGRPGTILTFFAWPEGAKGRNGPGQATIVAFAVPLEGLQFWAERLEDYKISYEGPIARFGDRVLTFLDQDGLQIELVGQRGLSGDGERFGAVPAKYAVQRICGVTLAQEELGPTEQMLTGLLGFRSVDQVSNRYRYATGDEGAESFVDVLVMPGLLPGRVAVGTIHHVAWRTPTDRAQSDWREELLRNKAHVSPVLDRQYFRSIYFREPGGVLFEVATDPPGFTVDEPLGQLGTHLTLPPWLEPQRGAIEQAVPPLRLPERHLAPVKAIG
jgi:glyoxalase family protein